VAVTLIEMAEVVKPRHAITILADDPDNRILECAEEGDADYIVTGDKAMLILKQHWGFRVIPLRKYLSGKERL
jgi:predicted nucleic acid-binding protein